MNMNPVVEGSELLDPGSAAAPHNEQSYLSGAVSRKVPSTHKSVVGKVK